MTARHRVTHGYVTVQTVVTPEGSRAYVDVRPGEMLPSDVPADEVAALLRQGRISLVEEPAPAPEASEPKRPTKSGSKADWKAYAISRGLGEEEADKATRDDLAALFAEEGDS